MTKELESAIELLTALEFLFNHSRCGICSGWMCSPNGETDYAHTKTCPLGKFLNKHAPDRPKKTYPTKGIVKKEEGWACNQCGSLEFSGSISEDAFDDDRMACGRCGGTEFHWEEGK